MANQVLANIQQALSDTQKQWKGVLLIPLLCLIFVSLTLIITPPATGYEYSIYEPYSLVFWIVAGIIFLFPFFYLILSSTKKSSFSFSKKSIYGLLVIALANLILLFHIPKARGYVLFSGGDTQHHIGYCVDILNSGHMLTQNHYPLSHVLVSITSQFTNMQLTEVILSVVPVFTVLFIIGMFCLARALKFSLIQVISITAFAILPIVGWKLTTEQIMPSSIGWSLIPLFLMLVYYVLFGVIPGKRYLILVLLLSVACWFIHPETVLFPAIMIGIVVGIAIIFNIISRRTVFPVKIGLSILFLLFFTVGFMIFFMGTSAGTGQLNAYMDIFSSIIGSVSTAVEPTIPTVPSTPVVSPNVTPVTPSSPPPATPVITDTPEIPAIIQTLISLFGENTIFAVFFTSTAGLARKISILILVYGQLLILSAICLFTSLWYLFSRKVREWDKRYLIIMALFFSFVIISLFMMTTYPDMWGDVYRIYKYPVIFGIFLLGLFFADIVCAMDKTKMMHLLSVIFTVGLIIMLVLSMGTFYKSSNIGHQSYHVTNEDLESMTLLYEYRNDNYLIEESGNQHQCRYNLFLYGMKEGVSTYGKNIRSFSHDEIHPPVNFGYYENSYLGESYSEKTYYLQTPAYGEYTMWMSFYHGYWGWDSEGITPESWEHLSVDSTVNKIISGDANNLSLINPLNN